MEYSSLYDLIESLERGTKLHIGVNFLGGIPNEKCKLPHARKIHTKEICESIKKYPQKFKKCYECRNKSLLKAIQTKKAFGGLCVYGIYEYLRPVIVDGNVIAVIFIGNVLTDEGKPKLLSHSFSESVLEEKMQTGFDYNNCNLLGNIIEGHILTLIEKYSNTNTFGSSLVENVKAFILENIEYDISLSYVASLFHYNKVYLGNAFKKQTGKTIKEFLNYERIKLAKNLLKSNLSVTEIAVKTGFNSPSYFNRVFKSVVKISPSEYKKLNQL